MPNKSDTHADFQGYASGGGTRVPGQPRPVSRRLALPLAVVMLSVVLVFLLAILYQGRDNIRQASRHMATHAIADFEKLVGERTYAMSGILDTLTQDKQLVGALKAGNRARLLESTQDYFQRLKSEYQISHLYFHDAKRFNLLRVHHPESHGDPISRASLRAAERFRKTASGIEPGPFGPYTLRVVSPVIDRTVLVGYVELGMEIRDLLDAMHRQDGLDIVMALKKHTMERRSWENASKVFGYDATWDSYPDDVVIYSSVKMIPEAVRTLFSKELPEEVELRQGARQWRALRHPIRMAANAADDGSLIFLHDVTAAQLTLNRLLWVSGIGALLLLAMLLTYVLELLKGTDKLLFTQKESIREGKERLKSILDHAPLGIWLADLEGHCQFVNRTLSDALGVSNRRHLSEKLSVLTGFPGGVECPGCQQRCLNSEAACQQTLTARFADGREHVLEVIKAPLHNAQGDAVGVVGIALDVTERNKNELALRLYAQLFENCSEAFVVTDADNRIIDINPAFTRLTGYALDEVRGENPRILSSGRVPPETYAEMWRLIEEKGQWQGELWDRRKDGRIYPKWTNIFVIRDPAGTITHHAATFSDISEQKAAQERIEHLAHHDPLTGLCNRHSFTHRINQAILTARRENLAVAAMFIDLDRFKAINDTLGHAVGDRLLIEIAKRLRSCVRESDIVSRLGGDEFIVALTALGSVEDARCVAEKIQISLGRACSIDGVELNTSPSIGIAIYPVDGETPDTLIKNADRAMYRAKELGRNNVQYYSYNQS